jgi:hypothetical protein
MSRTTWGPFSGAQLTVIITAIVLCVGFSGTLAAAIAYSNVALYDPVVNRRVKVDLNGGLRISDGAGALTVDGSVITSDAAPANYFRLRLNGIPTACTQVLTAPAGRAVVLDTIAVNTHVVNGPPGSGKYIAFGIGTFCSALLEVNPPGVGLITIPLRPGITIPSGQSLWIVGAETASSVLFLGHYVAAAAVPASSFQTMASGASSVQSLNRLR